MKKTFFSLAVISIVAVSCSKEKNEIDHFARELSLESAQINLPSSGGELNTTAALVEGDNVDYFTSGELEYIQQGMVVANVDFGQGEGNSIAELTMNGTSSNIELKKDDTYYDGKKSKYKKVIVKPLVKSDDCGYIIAGIIKYYDYTTGEWVATIDFGDLTCDEWATKTTADSNEQYIFSLKDWKK